MLLSDLNLKDEFGMVAADSLISDVARGLHATSVKVVLVRAMKDKGIRGVITQQHFLKVCATGIDPAKTFARDKMQTDILRIRSDTPIEEAVKIIGEKEPDAVIIVDAKGKARGYLSPADYRQLKATSDSSNRAVLFESDSGDEEAEELSSGATDLSSLVDYDPTLVSTETVDKDVLKLIYTRKKGDAGDSMLLPNQDSIMAIATRGGFEGHGVRQLHLEGARIVNNSALMRQGDQTISLWPLSSVDKFEGSLRSYLELAPGASNDGALVMLMDAKNAKQRLNQKTWNTLIEISDEYTGVEGK